jgi:hypothetical protein
MDHFNATVQNGALVSTRRGLQVMKTKHQGTRFVNSFAASDPTSNTGKEHAFNLVDLGRPLETRFKFVTKPKEKTRLPASTKGKAAPSPGKATEDEDSRRQTKLMVRRNTATDAARSITEPDSNAPEAGAGTLVQRGDGTLPSPLNIWRAKPWRTHNGYNEMPFNVSEKSRELINLYFNVVPGKMYPYDDILEYNPVRTHSFFERVHRDLVTLHCVVMAASIVESVAIKGERCTKETSYYISRVCNMVNGKLQARPGKFEKPVLECVVAMAICGVSRVFFFFFVEDAWLLESTRLTFTAELRRAI